MTSYIKPTVELIGPSGEADDVSFNDLVDETFINEPTLDATIIEDSLNDSPNNASPNDASPNDASPNEPVYEPVVCIAVQAKFHHDQNVENCGQLFQSWA